ncbi:MAG: restriction endonuclease [Nocardioides sp.]
MDADDATVSRATSHYPPADITSVEFEEFAATLFKSGAAEAGATDIRVQLHEVIEGADGSYDFDATVRYELAGMDFLVLVEAKAHKHPIKRELVQVLHQKLQSVGAHKAVLISTAPFQSGALGFALAHGIALVTVTEGRFTFETKSAYKTTELTREQALEYYDLPTFVGHAYSAAGDDAVGVTLMSPEHADYIVEKLFPQLE